MSKLPMSNNKQQSTNLSSSKIHRSETQQNIPTSQIKDRMRTLLKETQDNFSTHQPSTVIHKSYKAPPLTTKNSISKDYSSHRARPVEQLDTTAAGFNRLISQGDKEISGRAFKSNRPQQPITVKRTGSNVGIVSQSNFNS